MKFADWFKYRLKVGPFLKDTDLSWMLPSSRYKVVINVSCENYDFNMIDALSSQGILYFWFPMNEHKKDIGLNSIFGALKVIRDSELREYNVYLHCHAGVNRSPIVLQSYYYMRTGTHLYEDRVIDPAIEEMFVVSDRENQRNAHTVRINYPNRLYAACMRGYLPPLSEYEKFLEAYMIKLNESNAAPAKIGYGGYLDTLKKSINNF